jgi:D-alanyl-lipoteichoic acid acyltransferase DltB (MBOAT superfamily)
LLPPFPVLLVVFGEREKRLTARPPMARELAIVCLAGCLIVGVFPAVEFASTIPALKARFPLNHAVKLAMFLVTIEAMSRFAWGLERLAGYNIEPIIDKCYLATTPAEFWRRYNTRVGKWLYLNVFVPSGGRRVPIRGVFATFFVSAVLHEVAFAIATSRFTGFQFTFFILQAPAVAVSGRLQPRIDRAGLAVRTLALGITVLWFYFTSVFFFEGVNRIFPFVYGTQPWLPW